MATLSPFALTTVADVKESLGIASSDTSKDNLITRKINQATSMIEAYTGRHFALTTYTNEEYDATGTNQITLKNYPVINLTDFGLRDGSQNLDDWEEAESQLYFLDNNAGVLDLNFGTGGGWNRFRFSYTAGYDPIPDDIAEAASTLAAYLYANSPANSGISYGTSARSKQEGQRKVEYYDTSLGQGKNGRTTDQEIFARLGITGTLNNYSSYPVLADK